MNDEKLIQELHNKGIYLPLPNVEPIQTDLTGRLVKLQYDYYGCFYKYHIFIKKGFIFDGGSKSKITWSFLGSPHVGYDKIPCFIHDVFYGCQGLGKPLTMEKLERFATKRNKCPDWVNDNFVDTEFFYDKLFDVELEREETDWVWLKLMDDFTVCWAKRNAMYTGVRAGGDYAWNDNTMVDIEKDRKLITVCKEL